VRKIYRQKIADTGVVTVRFDNLSNIFNNLHFIEMGMNKISAVSFVTKTRWLYLLVLKTVNGCTSCLSILNKLVAIGKEAHDDNFVLLNQLTTDFENSLQSTIQHIESHNEYGPSDNTIVKFNIAGQASEQILNSQGLDPSLYSLIKVVPTDKVPTDEDEICVVCLDDYSNGTEVSMLPCGHIYHTTCIMGWLAAHKTCPIGRCEITSLAGLINSKLGNNIMI
jgi:hypothetical protein